MDFNPLSLSDQKKGGIQVQGGCKKIRYKRFYAMFFSPEGPFPGKKRGCTDYQAGESDNYRPFYAMIRKTFSLYAI
jgi:hypothetical protein